MPTDDERVRCWWSTGAPPTPPTTTPSGVGHRDDRYLFEKLCLEGFQAGLSWLTILNKRPAFREAFDGFDRERVAGYTEADVQRLLGDAGIVRHRRRSSRPSTTPGAPASWSTSAARWPPMSGSFEPEPATPPAVADPRGAGGR